MNSLAAALRKSQAVTIGIGLAWILSAPGPCVGGTSQDRYTVTDGEFIPPLSFSEKDFQQGFLQVFPFLDYP